MFNNVPTDIFFGQVHEDEGLRSGQENEGQEGADAAVQNGRADVGQRTTNPIFPAALILNNKPRAMLDY